MALLLKKTQYKPPQPAQPNPQSPLKSPNKQTPIRPQQQYPLSLTMKKTRCFNFVREFLSYTSAYGLRYGSSLIIFRIEIKISQEYSVVRKL